MNTALPEASPYTNSVSTQQFVYRVDVMPHHWASAKTVKPGLAGDVYAYPVYWFATSQPCGDFIERVTAELLIDPILQQAVVRDASHHDVTTWQLPAALHAKTKVSVRFLPGVTDNVAKTVESNLTYLNPPPDTRIQVASGMVYLLEQRLDTPDQLAYLLFNPLIERARVVHIDPNIELSVDMNFIGMPAAAPWHAEPISLDLDDRGLEALSQSRCLALTLPEMQTIQAYFSRPDVTALRQQQGLPTEPTDIELEVLAQTWSEHCKHKIFSAKIRYTDMSDPDEVQEVEIDSLFKTFIVGATEAVKPDRPDLLSLFKDNAGVVQWDDQTAVCFKVETHNSPSALEPYGGALTGIVGVNRDILGTGLGAKPVFNTDVFCFANPDEPHANYSRMIPAPAILLGVRKGVEDGGNKSGIPTVNGALFFDPRFRAKPLVFCGTGGVMPLKVNGKPAYEKYTQPGDLIVMAGGRVGKDGIHGATFSSEALSETSPLSAVQIGDPLTQKRMGDFILEARDAGLLSGITDNGAGGLSSSVGEMAEQTGGATIDLDQVPLKYPGLKAYEAVISESQERMTLSITPKHQQALQRLADKHGVELSIIGYFHNQGTFDIKAGDTLLASLDLDFLHKGLPQMTLKAYWEVEPLPTIRAEAPPDLGVVLLDLLKYPNICSREYLIRRYDHEVQGRSVVKPLMGPLQLGPCDAAVMKVHYDRPEGLVVSNGLCPNLSDWDTYHMATNAVDEAVRNAVAAGADPLSIVLLDNFCWPDPVFSPRNLDGEEKLAQLVRACVGLYDIATRYKAPFISGKDSMKNDYDDGQNRLSIPPTLLISAMGKLPDVAMAQTSHFKTPGDLIYLLGTTNFHPGGSQYYHYMGWSNRYVPQVNVLQAHANYKRLHQAIMAGKLNSCHDLSDGGCLVAIAESIIGSSYGAHIDLTAMATHSPELRWDDLIFSETPSRLLFSVAPEHRDWVETHFAEYPLIYMGQVTDAPELKLDWKKSQRMLTIGADRLRAAWSQPPAQCWGRVPSPVRTQATDFGSADFGQVAIEQEGELRG